MRKVYVDANIMVYYCKPSKKQNDMRYLFTYDFFRRGLDCEFHLVISDWAEEEALRFVEEKELKALYDHIRPKMIVIKISEKQKKKAKQMSKNWPDARHALMAKDEGCEVIATLDDDFDAFSHIVRSAYPQSI